MGWFERGLTLNTQRADRRTYGRSQSLPRMCRRAAKIAEAFKRRLHCSDHYTPAIRRAISHLGASRLISTIHRAAYQQTDDENQCLFIGHLAKEKNISFISCCAAKSVYMLALGRTLERLSGVPACRRQFRLQLRTYSFSPETEDFPLPVQSRRTLTKQHATTRCFILICFQSNQVCLHWTAITMATRWFIITGTLGFYCTAFE